MSILEKLQSFFVLAAVFLGLLFGNLEFLAKYAEYAIVPALLIMLYSLFLSISF